MHVTTGCGPSSDHDQTRSYPIAVIGAGPVGLAAAAHLVARGERPLVFEAGPTVGAYVAAWRHVQVFSPWRYNVDAVAAKLLQAHGWAEPDPDALPTGADLIAQYLRPLASVPEIAPHLRLNSRITRITRTGYDKMKTEGRDRAPFTLRVRRAEGLESNVLARAVIDATGTWGTPNRSAPMAWLPRERWPRAIASRTAFLRPWGADRRRYAGRRVLVVGSGHSAFNVLLDLVELAASSEPARITWAVRRSSVGQMYGGGAADALPARGQLGERLRAAVATGHVRLVTSFRIASVQRGPDGVSVTGADRVALGPFDEIVAATGFRRDSSA